MSIVFLNASLVFPLSFYSILRLLVDTSCADCNAPEMTTVHKRYEQIAN